ncbi:hypothetical protein CRE_01279 [Caenorhabditis remanei]|uniref:Uncharacterized protein n=1 Tax=Caenorhabditis remanei TaxID=31234 RepID=E3N9R0_CAERE|nr:hypothetical protein CRE_01279 [Caenorhabditis remanei]
MSLPTRHLKDVSNDLRLLGFQVGPRSTSNPGGVEEPPQVTPPKPLPLPDYRSDLELDAEIQDAKAYHKKISSLYAMNLESETDEAPSLRDIPASNKCYMSREVHFDQIPSRSRDNCKDRPAVKPLPVRALDSKTQHENREDYGSDDSSFDDFDDLHFDQIPPRSRDNCKDRPAVKPLPTRALDSKTQHENHEQYGNSLDDLATLRATPASSSHFYPPPYSGGYDISHDRLKEKPSQDDKAPLPEDYGCYMSREVHFDHLPPRTLENSKDRPAVKPLPVRALDSKTQHENREDYGSDDSSFDDFDDLHFDHLSPRTLDNSKDRPRPLAPLPPPPPPPQVTPPRPLPQSPYSFTIDQELRLEHAFQKAGRRMPCKTLARAIQANLREVYHWYNKRLERKSKMLAAYKKPVPKTPKKIIPDAFGLRLLDLNFAQLYALEEYYSRGVYFVPDEVEKKAREIQAELSEVHEWLRRREWLEEKRTGRNADIYWLPAPKEETKKRDTVVQKVPSKEEDSNEKVKCPSEEILELKKQLEQERMEHEETKSQLSRAKIFVSVRNASVSELKKQLEQEKMEHEETKSQLTHANDTITSQATDIRELNFWVATLKQKSLSPDDSRLQNLEKQMDQMTKDMEALKTPTPSLRDLIAMEIKKYATEPSMVQEVKNKKKAGLQKENFYRIQFSKSLETVAEKDKEIEELKKNLQMFQNINYELHDIIKQKNLLVETMTEHVKESEQKICDLEAELEKKKKLVPAKPVISLRNRRSPRYFLGEKKVFLNSEGRIQVMDGKY